MLKVQLLLDILLAPANIESFVRECKRPGRWQSGKLLTQGDLRVSQRRLDTMVASASWCGSSWVPLKNIGGVHTDVAMREPELFCVPHNPCGPLFPTALS